MHAPSTPGASPDVHVKPADERPLYGQFFLILRGHPHGSDGTVAVRAGGGQRRGVRFVDLRWPPTMGTLAIRRTGFATRSAGLRDACPARKRRGLAMHGSTGGVELLFQFFVFTTQALPLGFRPAQVLAQLLVLTSQPLELRGIERSRIGALRHTPVMPNSRAEYKRKMRVSAY